MEKIMKHEFKWIFLCLGIGIITMLISVIILFKEKNIIIHNATYDSQLADIYQNKTDYLGKKIEIQGYYQVIQNGDEDYHFIVQYIPFFNYTSFSEDEGGTQTGFYELDVKGIEIYSPEGEYPIENEWYTATGHIEEFTDSQNGQEYIRINLTDIKETAKPDDILDSIYNFDPGETIEIGIQTVTEEVNKIPENGKLSSKDTVKTEHKH